MRNAGKMSREGIIKLDIRARNGHYLIQKFRMFL